MCSGHAVAAALRGNRTGGPALFARPVDADVNCADARRGLDDRVPDQVLAGSESLFRPDLDGLAARSDLPYRYPRFGRRGADLRISTKPGRCRRDLRGKPCEQGQESKGDTVHRRGI